jgi:hypothetical protein
VPVALTGHRWKEWGEQMVRTARPRRAAVTVAAGAVALAAGTASAVAMPRGHDAAKRSEHPSLHVGSPGRGRIHLEVDTRPAIGHDRVTVYVRSPHRKRFKRLDSGKATGNGRFVRDYRGSAGGRFEFKATTAGTSGYQRGRTRVERVTVKR